MRSKRNPSTLYSLVHVSTESISSLPIIRCSVAVFEQHVDVVTAPLAGSSRW